MKILHALLHMMALIISIVGKSVCMSTGACKDFCANWTVVTSGCFRKFNGKAEPQSLPFSI